MGTPSISESATPSGHGHGTCELTMHPCLNVEGNAYLLNALTEDKKVRIQEGEGVKKVRGQEGEGVKKVRGQEGEGSRR